jgi:uncharacterized caspase-like protein
MRRLWFCVTLLLVVAAPPFAQAQKPDLWIFAVGINRYTRLGKNSQLRFAIPNTQGIINAFKGQEGKAFNKVYHYLVRDGSDILPTYRNIITHLGFLKNAKPDDVVILYFSCHGEVDNKGGFFILASDAGFNKEGEADFTNAVSMDILKESLDIPAKKIVMFDSCYSGAAVKTLGSSETIVFCSSHEEEVSFEGPYLRGAFSLSVAEGLSGKAAVNGTITIDGLQKYISGRVIQITSDMQHPATYIPENMRDFVLGEL